MGRRIQLPDGGCALRTYGELQIKKGKNDLFSKRRRRNRNNARYDDISLQKGQEIPKNRYTKWFDYDKINSTLSVRYRETGDYITLAGGGRKTVKSFMIDEKIPKEERGKILLAADGSHSLDHRIPDQ